MTTSAFCRMVTSVQPHHWWTISQEAAMNALPGIPLALSLMQLLDTIHPQYLRSDDPKNPEAEDFILTDVADLEQIADVYMKRRFTIANASQDTQSRIAAQQAKADIIATWRRRIECINKTAAAFGIKQVNFGLAISTTPPSPGSQIAPYSAAGNKSCHLSDPVIVCTPIPPPAATAQTPPEDPQLKLNRNENIKTFFIVHEVVHIAKNHPLISAITYLVFAILATSLWVVGLQSGLSLASLTYTYAVVLGTTLLYQLFYYTQRRSQEREADLEAIDYLKSKEGAIAAMQDLEKTSIDDLEHPPLAERLEYIQAHPLKPRDHI